MFKPLCSFITVRAGRKHAPHVLKATTLSTMWVPGTDLIPRLGSRCLHPLLCLSGLKTRNAPKKTQEAVQWLRLFEAFYKSNLIKATDDSGIKHFGASKGIRKREEDSSRMGEECSQITKQDPEHTWDLGNQRERQAAGLKEGLHGHLQGRYTEASKRTRHR